MKNFDLKCCSSIKEPKEPTECSCGCSDLGKIDIEYNEGFESEYSLRCKSCNKIVSNYSYGHIKVFD